MNNPLNSSHRDDVHLLAGAYAIDAIDDVERVRFERHLATCPSCQDDVAGFRDAAAGLGVAAAEPPPASRRVTVLDEVDRTRQVSRRGNGRTHATGRLVRGVAAAACLATALLTVTTLQQRSRADRYAAVARIAEAADARIVRLNATGQPGSVQSGSVQVTYSASAGAAILVGDGLAASERGRTYELWFIEGGEPKPIMTFDATADKVAVVRLQRSPAPGAVLAITDEPDGGSPAPTTQPMYASDAV